MTIGSSTSSIKVAIIGVGYLGRYHCDAWLRIEGAEIVGICDSDLSRAESVASQYSQQGGSIPHFADVHQLLEATNPDVITVATPPVTHLEMVKIIAPTGCAMMVQAPFCNSLEEAEEAVDVAHQFKACVAVHAPVRYQPWYREAGRLLEDGAIGEPYQIAFRYRPGDGRGPRAYIDRHPRFQTISRFLVQESACHWIDVFRTMLGEPIGVFARLTRINPVINGEDAGYLMFDFATGARGVFDANRVSDHAAVNCRLTRGEMLLEGSTGSLRLDGAGRLWRRGFGDIDEREHRYNWRNQQYGGDCVLSCTRSIMASWQANREPPTSARRFLPVKRVVECAYESAEKGVYVPVTPPERPD